ncbi:hypothetical protein [Pseudomonas aeruginosa]|uniref:trypsin-like serine peptidase n=1 Tax=Pseudomonas aeruginosa TaxID=287 RepID=UPI0029CAA155|nr:hypothetical protein [Pseudomonas aeruginosa]
MRNCPWLLVLVLLTSLGLQASELVPDADINSAQVARKDVYQGTREFQLRIIDLLTASTTQKIYRLEKERAKALRRYIEAGLPVPDSLIINRTLRTGLNLAGIPDKDAYRYVLVNKEFANSILEKYPNFENEIDGVKVRVPKRAIDQMHKEAKPCYKGEQIIDLARLNEYMTNCFSEVDNPAASVSPPNSDGKTYSKAIDLLSSLVDADNKHLCMVSVYKKGVWITARHCLFTEGMVGRDLYIIVNGKKEKVDWDRVRECNSGCDIAFIELKTPVIADADLPSLNVSTKSLNWDTPIFNPGMALGYDMSASIANDKGVKSPLRFIWSPVGKGYCRIVRLEKNACLIHTCSTAKGFSGAPIYVYDLKTHKVGLLAIHSGGDYSENDCKDSGTINYAHLASFKGVNP